MRRPRLSHIFVISVVLLILAIVAMVFISNLDAASSRDQAAEERLNRRINADDIASGPRASARKRKTNRIEKLISERFTDAHQKTFYHGSDGIADDSYEGYGGDIADSYREKGLMNFYGEMRHALRGNEESIAAIFTTYRAEPEGYGGYINMLIQHLGDDFFVQQIKKQPESIQYSILGKIWQVIYRSPLDYQSDGSIPQADSGKHYPKSGALFLELRTKELQSDHWQRQIKKKNQQGNTPIP